jgi:hypothetical protein
MRDRMGPKPHCALKVSAWIVKYFLVPCVTLYCTVSVSHRREVQNSRNKRKFYGKVYRNNPRVPRVRAGSCDLPGERCAENAIAKPKATMQRACCPVRCAGAGHIMIKYFSYDSYDSTANRQSSGTSRGIGQRVAVLQMLPGPRVMEVP